MLRDSRDEPVRPLKLESRRTQLPSTFNFNEFSLSYPIRDSRGMFAFAERKILGTDNIKAYVDANYQNAVTEGQLAPGATGSFTTAGQIELVIPARTTSPLPTTDGRTRAQLAATNNGGFALNAINPFNPFNQDITGGSRARLAEFGNRIYINNTDAMLLTAGLKGENIAGKWNFDAGYSYSSIRDTSRNTVPSSARFNRLLNGNDSFFQPGSSDYLGTTIPYNPFGYYKVAIPNNQKIVSAGLITSKDVNESKLNQFNAVISTGSLLDLPAGPVGFAVGADARHEQLNQYPDPYSLTGDLIGSSAGAITRGHRKVWGAFAEWNIPVVKNAPGAHSLSATAAVRHESFMTSNESTNVPKVGLRWQPIDESLTLRASWSKGVRQPSLYELYASPTSGLTPIIHPLGTFPFEPEQSVTVSGNRRLQPEKTKYLNTGVIWSPKGSGLTFGVDYWEAERRGTVSNDYQNTANRFFGRIPRGAAGSAPGGLLPGESVVLYPDGAINVINSVFFNVGLTKVAGFDYTANYVYKTDSMGRFELSTAWSTYTHYKSSKIAGTPLLEKADQVVENSTGADDAVLKWKGRTQVEWAYKGMSFLVGGNYTHGFNDTTDDSDPKAYFRVASRVLFDAQVSYRFQNRVSPWLSDTKVTVGARNVFDRDPPFASGNGGNSTGYPGYIYSAEGRFWYVSLSRKF
ncbi:MAG: TonB-dependent receptor [Opitutus sp.]|nr:TonB-dependent receptor [Opitutus sp.]